MGRIVSLYSYIRKVMQLSDREWCRRPYVDSTHIFHLLRSHIPARTIGERKNLPNGPEYFKAGVGRELYQEVHLENIMYVCSSLIRS